MRYPVRQIFNRTIEALIGDGTPEQRLRNAELILRELDLYKEEVPEELSDELCEILADYARAARASDNVSSQLDRRLTERLLSLYGEVSGGVLTL